MDSVERRQVRVRVSRAVKRFGDVAALDHVTLDIEPGKFFFLLGPSGCGKTTLLRSLAGLVDLDEGEISFDNRSVTHVPAHRRNTALVFQNYALWPHMSVFDNVAFGLVERKVPKQERAEKVRSVLEMVRLAHLAERRPNELSGGQQQRVALARALVVEPDLVLLDEPLSNLDANLRRQMRYELKRIQEQTGITMVYVTHDQSEALSMAHRMAVMRAGRVMQVGTPEEVYRSPKSVFVAGFVGRTNFVPGTVTALKDDLVCAKTALGAIWGRSTISDLEEGQQVVCSIRPEYLDWTGAGTQGTETREAEKQDGGSQDGGSQDGGSQDTEHQDAETKEKVKDSDIPQESSVKPALITAAMTGRLFLGEVEERTYQAGDIELVARFAAPRSGAPRRREHELLVQVEDVVILPAEDESSVDGAGSGSDHGA